jgi:hypothetical protein
MKKTIQPHDATAMFNNIHKKCNLDFLTLKIITANIVPVNPNKNPLNENIFAIVIVATNLLFQFCFKK